MVNFGNLYQKMIDQVLHAAGVARSPHAVMKGCAYAPHSECLLTQEGVVLVCIMLTCLQVLPAAGVNITALRVHSNMTTQVTIMTSQVACHQVTLASHDAVIHKYGV